MNPKAKHADLTWFPTFLRVTLPIASEYSVRFDDSLAQRRGVILQSGGTLPKADSNSYYYSYSPATCFSRMAIFSITEVRKKPAHSFLYDKQGSALTNGSAQSHVNQYEHVSMIFNDFLAKIYLSAAETIRETLAPSSSEWPVSRRQLIKSSAESRWIELVDSAKL